MKREKAVTLREAREAAGLTQIALAKATGVNVNTIVAIERGTVPGKVGVQHTLSDYLRVPFRLMWPVRVLEFNQLQEFMRENPRSSKPEAEKAK